MDIAGVPTKKHSFGAYEPESPMVRKPFSPISSTASSKSNIANLLDDLNNTTTYSSDAIQKTLPPSDVSFTTPLKTTTTILDDENRTPKTMPIPVPPTPSTISVPMQTAMTPAPAPVLIPFSTKQQVEETAEEIEYSFEERRAGFVLPKVSIKPMIQV